jgi:hypothetical protein
MDADKILWNTITIKVPPKMVNITKKGRVNIGNTLTKTNNLSKRQKTSSIRLLPSEDNKPHIITDGKEWNVNELKARVKMANVIAKRNKNVRGEQVLGAFVNRLKPRAINLVDARLGIDPTVKGYSWDAQKNKWKARIKINQRLRHLGYFDTEEQAHQAYLVAKRELLRNQRDIDALL